MSRRNIEEGLVGDRCRTRLAAELTYERLGRQRESFRRLGVICQWHHALALTPTLPSLGRRKGPDTILRLLFLLLFFVLVLLIKHEIERRRKRAIGTVVIGNAVHIALRNDTKNNWWPAGRATGKGGLTGDRATGSRSGSERVARNRRRRRNTGMCVCMC